MRHIHNILYKLHNSLSNISASMLPSLIYIKHILWKEQIQNLYNGYSYLWDEMFLSTCSLEARPRKFPRKTSYPVMGNFRESTIRLERGSWNNEIYYSPWSYAANACEPTTPFDTHLWSTSCRMFRTSQFLVYNHMFLMFNVNWNILIVQNLP